MISPRPSDSLKLFAIRQGKISIAAGAFAPGLPHRDRLLSADHAVLAPDGIGGHPLVAARRLVNGTTVVRHPVDRITYWHIALDRHENIVADGRPLPLDDPRLGAGWHLPETSLRWTTGDASVDVAGIARIGLTFANAAVGDGGNCGHTGTNTATEAQAHQ